MSIQKLKEMGYVFVGEVDGLILYSNINSLSKNKKTNDRGFIF